MKITKGKLFVITHGEYSDYDLIALCKAKKDLEIDKLVEKYIKIANVNRTYLSGSFKFVNWLINSESCIEELELNELNLYYMFEQISLEKKDTVGGFIKKHL